MLVNFTLFFTFVFLLNVGFLLHLTLQPCKAASRTCFCKGLYRKSVSVLHIWQLLCCAVCVHSLRWGQCANCSGIIFTLESNGHSNLLCGTLLCVAAQFQTYHSAHWKLQFFLGILQSLICHLIFMNKKTASGCVQFFLSLNFQFVQLCAPLWLGLANFTPTYIIQTCCIKYFTSQSVWMVSISPFFVVFFCQSSVTSSWRAHVFSLLKSSELTFDFRDFSFIWISLSSLFNVSKEENFSVFKTGLLWCFHHTCWSREEVPYPMVDRPNWISAVKNDFSFISFENTFTRTVKGKSHIMGNQKVGYNEGGFIAVSDTDGAFGWKTL